MGSEGRGTARRLAQRGAVSDPVILEVRYRSEQGGAGAPIEGGEQVAVTRADVARRLNDSIYYAGQSLATPQDGDFELTFFCECGCLHPVTLTLAQFDAADGAWLEQSGHSGPESTR